MKKYAAAILTLLILAMTFGVTTSVCADAATPEYTFSGLFETTYVNPEYEELADIIESAENEDESPLCLFSASGDEEDESDESDDSETYDPSGIDWYDAGTINRSDYKNDTAVENRITEIIVDTMVNREQNFSIEYTVSGNDPQFLLLNDDGSLLVNDDGYVEPDSTLISSYIDDFFDDNKIFKYTDDSEPDEADYLKYHYAYTSVIGCKVGFAYGCDYSDGIFTETLTYYFSPLYNSTKAQEEAVTAKVEELLDSFSFTDTTPDYIKVRTIYDYLCANVTYDNTFEGREDSGSSNFYYSLTAEEQAAYLLTHTAYAALINNTCVCQGYANAFFRLAQESGVKARIVVGWGGVSTGIGNGNHAWNMVKIGDFWYYLDATWDADYYQNELPYNYFLRTKANMDEHTVTSSFAKTLSVAPGDFILGDIDYDGIVDGGVIDAVYLAQYIAGRTVEFQLYDQNGNLKTYGVDTARMDLDCDGKITPRDSMILTRYLAGWEGYETLPVA